MVLKPKFLMLKRAKLLESIVKYIPAAILLVVPLYPKFPFITVPGTFVAIRLEDLLMAFSATIAVVLFFKKRQILQSRIARFIILFLLVGFVSVLSSILVTKTTLPHISFLHWLRRIEYFIPFFLGLAALKINKSNLEFYLKILMIVIFMTFVWGFGQKHFGWPIIITQNEEYSKGVALRWIPGSHINSTFAGHYDLGTFLVLVLPIVITSFVLLRGVKTKLILLVVFFSGLWLLVNSASRISLASYLVAATFSLVLIKKYKLIPLILIISVLFTGFSTNLLIRYGRLVEVSKEKFQNLKLINYAVPKNVIAASTTPIPIPTPTLEDRSTNIRLNVEWPRAIRAFTKNPLLGTGYSSIGLATDNDYLRLLGEVGLLGFISFILIFVKISQHFVSNVPLMKTFEDYQLAIVSGFFGALPGLFMNAVFIDIFEASKFAIIFWLFTGFVLAIGKK